MKIVYSVLNDLKNSESSDFFAFDFRTGWFPIRYTMFHYLEFRNIDSLLNKLCDYDFDAACIQSAYYSPFNIDIYHSSLLGILQEDFLVAGHIIDNEELFFEKNGTKPDFSIYYSLHEQCVFVNLNKYKQLNKPSFNLSGRQKLPVPKRSNVNFHDSYTPLQLNSTEKFSDFDVVGSGSGFIAESIKNNLPVLNFPEEIRRNKFYIYPEEADLVFNCLKNRVPYCGTRDSSFRYLNTVLNFNNEKFYISNTEPFFENQYPNKSLDFFIGCCSGFKTNQMIKQTGFNEQTVFIHFDISDLAINSYKALLQKDGNEIQKITNLVSSEDWNAYRNCVHEFKKIDIVNDYKLLEKYFLGNSLFWFSNCFYYKSTYLNYGGHKIMTPKILEMINWLNEINQNLWLDGLILPGSDLPHREISGFAKDINNEFRSTSLIQKKFS